MIPNFFKDFGQLFVQVWGLLKGYPLQWILLVLIALIIILVLKKSPKYRHQPTWKGFLQLVKNGIIKFIEVILKYPILIIVVFVAVLFGTGMKRWIDLLLGRPSDDISPEDSVISFDGSVELGEGVKKSIKEAQRLQKSILLPPPISIVEIEQNIPPEAISGLFRVAYSINAANPYSRFLYLKDVNKSYTVPFWLKESMIAGVYSNKDFSRTILFVEKNELKKEPQAMQHYLEIGGQTVEDII